MPLYNPDTKPDALEINSVAAKIEALTGMPITMAQKSAVANMTRKEISDYIKDIIR